MATQTRTVLKGYFNTGDTPTEAQFADLIDSFQNPTDDGTTVVLTGAQTLTDKTLTAPVLSGTVTGTYTLAGTPTFPANVLLDADVGVQVQAYDVDTLKADTTDQLTAGFTAAIDDDGTLTTGTYTPAPATGNFKTIINGGAFTLAPPAPATGEAMSLSVLIRNNASAGAVTTSGFTIVKGDSFTTTNAHEFICHIDVFDVGGTEWSALTVVALQ